MQTKTLQAPINPVQIEIAEPSPIQGAPQKQELINLSTFAVPPGAQPRLIKDPLQPDTYRIQLELPEDDLSRGRIRRHIPYERIPTTALGREGMEQFKTVMELQGLRPSQAVVRYQPKVSQWDEEIRLFELGEAEDIPTHVFGADDRSIL